MSDSVQAAIIASIRTVLRDTGRDAIDVEPDKVLGAELGIDSLDLAQVVVLLERTLGVDPFRDQAAGPLTMRTVGDLISIYSEATSRS